MCDEKKEILTSKGHRILIIIVGDVVAQWLVRQTWDQKVNSSSPGRCTHVEFLGKTLNSHTHIHISPPSCINGNQQIAWGKPDKMLRGNLR